MLNKLLVICAQRGVSPIVLVDVEVAVVGGVETITVWNAVKLGAVPTAQEIAAVTDVAAATAAHNTRRDKTLWTPSMTALVKALNTRLRNANVDQVTVGAFRASIEAEYDLLGN